ncbi:glycoside hydrolase family 105 protein [Halalkalibacterium halodurans]|jgi:unsaturated rhamnogalacturonyl hydrolase|uniref:Rhamnogalacturonyl hydrolase n=1 Tax=Halalkalibacterium halodurans TaxID=86665 RepID=A0A0M0KLV3_ALKHA|nr:glycoside hydrolase family 105 protein [Halalkalibacterium halodurans]MED3645499.1 glycoside hydrolase family 105 protein [Halalkalibacterium halodurans]TES57944.1 glycoside hydrolase family 105 protein [Halalkalibacterium halodurans]TPE70770.1 glycoside hydrolase family 105 protein [Halalkalibacterium halodurans]
MKRVQFDREDVLQKIDRIVNRTFEMDHVWDWPAGVAFYGVGLAYEATKKDAYLQRLKEWFDEYMDYGIPPMCVNIVSMGHTLLTLYQHTGEEKYLQLAIEKADYLLHDAPRFAEGVFQHTVGGGVSVFPEQAWVDTLFMAGYFLIRMGDALNNQAYMDEGIRQFRGHEKYLQDSETNFYYHGWDHLSQSNMSGIFWARGNAWAAYTMAASLRMIDVKEPAFMEIHGSLRDLMSALLNVQSEQGLWHTILTDPSSYEETSGSAGIAAALVLQGANTPKGHHAAQRAFDALLEKVDARGTVLGVSTGTAVMNHADGYRMTPNRRIEGWGQGLALTFFSHVLMRYTETEQESEPPVESETR